jgi:5-methylcytosine-specific restriction endonuclease McrA
MPSRPPQHRPSFWKRVERIRTDAIDRSYGTQAWRNTAKAAIERDRGICRICGRIGANTAHHIRAKRDGGTDDLSNLEAVHGSCHSRRHKLRS